MASRKPVWKRPVVVVCCAAPASATEATTDGGPLSWPRSVAEGVGRPRGASLPNCKLLHSISVVIEKRLRLNFFFCSTRRRQTFWKLESVASRRQRDQEAEHHQRFVLKQKKPFLTKFFDRVDTKLKTAATRLISVSLEKPKNRFEEVKSLEG